MDDFLREYKKYNIRYSVLNLSDSQDYFEDKLIYLDKLDKNDYLRYILTDITEISYENNHAKSLKWLKYFPNLVNLFCGYNDLDSNALKDLEYVPKLQILSIHNNNIENLNILKSCNNLTSIYCSKNKIKELLYLSLSIKHLKCDKNQLKELNLQGLINLKSLNCSFNQLTKLDILGCTKLAIINCDCNKLEELDLQNLANLHTLYCSYNKIKIITGLSDLNLLDTLDCSTNLLSHLDLSKCASLKKLVCHENRIYDADKMFAYLSLVLFKYDTHLTSAHKNTYEDYEDYEGLDVCYICYDTCFEKTSKNPIEPYDLSKKILTKCKHIYHAKCLQSWFTKSSTTNCPYCRKQCKPLKRIIHRFPQFEFYEYFKNYQSTYFAYPEPIVPFTNFVPLMNLIPLSERLRFSH